MSAVEVPNLELYEELGRGTFSIVYRARRGTESCAVKLPRDGRLHQTRRFRSEAIALARARHPVLPSVWEIGETRGTPYLVMELCDGETLAQHLVRAPSTIEQIVDLGRQLASALAEIHRIGLVHCDVKPQNIVIDAAGRVRLIDFGLAASTDTGSMLRAGTMPYAAPEQMTESYEQIDGRADLYGLGAVLHECLYGEPPAGYAATGSPGVSGWSSGVRRKRSTRALGGDSPTGLALAAVVARLLERDPDDRYPSATALAYDLERMDELGQQLSQQRELALNLRELDKPLVVGRDRELASLDQTWQEARSGDGRVVLVRGVAGSGKTSLTRAFQHEVSRQGGTILAAAGTRYSTKPFAVISALVEGYLESAVTREQRAAHEDRLREASGEFGRFLKVLSPALGKVFSNAQPIPRSDDAQHVFIEGLSEVLLRLARAVAPSVLFVDDVQWLDAASASVIKGVTARVEAQPTVMILAARDEPAALAPIDPIIDDSAKADLLTIALEPLGVEATRELIAGFLATSPGDDLTAWIAGINDGTPLNAVQILRALLDEGLLLPHQGGWRFEPGALERAHLPQRTMEILIRRIRQLGPLCREVLAGAAVLGSMFPISALPHLTQLSDSEVADALSEAQQANLVQARPHQSFAFVHESVREAVIAGFVGERAPELHRRAAEAYELLAANGRADASDPAFAYALAAHWGAAGPAAASTASVAANLGAAHMAFASCDNYNAIEFFRVAKAQSESTGDALKPADRVLLGEALLRIGHLREGLAEVESALLELTEPVERANALMRVAWAYLMQFNTDKAWPALESGFEALGEKPPRESGVGFAAAALTHYLPGKARPPLSSAERRRCEALWNLCERGYQLAAEGGRPLTLIQVTLKMLDLAERLGPSAMASRSHAYYGFVLVALGFRKPGLDWLTKAQASADAIGEPSTQGWVHQVRALGLSWAGDTESALAASSRCLLEFGSWRGLHEYCLFAWNQHTIECLHGRYLEGWAWIRRAVQKIDQHPGHPLIPELTILGARATLGALGREGEIPSILERLSRASIPTSSTSDYQLALMGSRIRIHSDRGDLGPEFEAVVADFRSRGYNPKRAPLVIGDYYVNVAHARVHAYLRCSPEDRPKRSAELGDALSDLRSAARIPLYEAHRAAVEGYWAMLNDDWAKAEHWFEKARELGERERAPAVLYAVHRGRAHLSKAKGRHESALIHARMAELLARQNGAAYRLRWIVEEFALDDARPVDAKHPGASEGTNAATPASQSRQRRQLRALLRLSQLANVDTEPEAVFQLVLDELVRAAGASSGVICSRDANGDVAVIAVCDTNASAPVSDLDDRSRQLVESALRANGPERMDDAVELVSRMAVPLRASGEPPVCICVRAAGCGVFTAEDSSMLEVLSAQAAVTLTLSRSLQAKSARNQATRAVEQQQIVDLLLGGVAHDLDRVLEGVQSSLDSTWVPVPQEQEALLRSTQRARQLSQQLLSLAQRSADPEELSLNEVVEASRPALERIVRKPLELRIALADTLRPVRAQRILVEQLLTNLALATRQFSSSTGALVIETRETEIDSELAARLRIAPGAYALLTLSVGSRPDTPDDPLARTSSLSSSRGLWLASAFAPAFQNRGGRLVTTNDAWIGASFSVLLPDARDRPSRIGSEPPGQHAISMVRGRVILIEPDAARKATVARAFEAEGFQTYAFTDGPRAVEFLQNDGGEIHVVVAALSAESDSVPEHVAALRRMEPHARVVYVSNHAAGFLRWTGIVKADEWIAVAPISAAELLEHAMGRVRRSAHRALSA